MLSNRGAEYVRRWNDLGDPSNSFATSDTIPLRELFVKHFLFTGVTRCSRSKRILLAAAWYFLLYLCFVFALVERKHETQKKIQYRSAEGKNAGWVSRVT